MRGGSGSRSRTYTVLSPLVRRRMSARMINSRMIPISAITAMNQAFPYQTTVPVCGDWLGRVVTGQERKAESAHAASWDYNLQSQTITLDSGFLFPHTPCPMLFCRFKKYRKKSRHHCSNIERGEAGEGFLLRVARDFWLRLYSLYMLGISMSLFQACHVIDFQNDIIKTAKRKQT